jgi:hypothetical protein
VFPSVEVGVAAADRRGDSGRDRRGGDDDDDEAKAPEAGALTTMAASVPTIGWCRDEATLDTMSDSGLAVNLSLDPDESSVRE